MNSVMKSLKQLLGKAYMEAVEDVAVSLYGMRCEEARRLSGRDRIHA